MDIVFSPHEQAQLLLKDDRLRKRAKVYSVFNNNAVYFAVNLSHQKERILLRVEGGKRPEGIDMAEYQLIGGVNPNYYGSYRQINLQGSPFEREEAIYVRIEDNKEVGMMDLARPEVMLGDRLVVIPRKSIRAVSLELIGKVVLLTGAVSRIFTYSNFIKHARKLEIVDSG